MQVFGFGFGFASHGFVNTSALSISFVRQILTVEGGGVAR